MLIIKFLLVFRGSATTSSVYLAQSGRLYMKVIKLIRVTFQKNRYERHGKEELFEPSVCTAANILRNMALNCPCGSLSIPTKQKGDVYRCIRCSKDTAGHAYNFSRSSYIVQSSKPDEPFFDMEFYDAAVALLICDRRKRPTIKQLKYRLTH